MCPAGKTEDGKRATVAVSQRHTIKMKKKNSKLWKKKNNDFHHIGPRVNNIVIITSIGNTWFETPATYVYRYPFLWSIAERGRRANGFSLLERMKTEKKTVRKVRDEKRTNESCCFFFSSYSDRPIVFKKIKKIYKSRSTPVYSIRLKKTPRGNQSIRVIIERHAHPVYRCVRTGRRRPKRKRVGLEWKKKK